jgi:hypothetical protein
LTTSSGAYYEENISGKLTDERFIKLSSGYECEQESLGPAIDALRRDIKEREEKKPDLMELDAAVLREFIERIYISAKDKTGQNTGSPNSL